MTPERRAKLEAAGHTIADPEDFLGLDEIDRRIVNLRLDVLRAIRQLREQQGLSQRQLADRLKVSQSRIAGIEKGQRASLNVILKVFMLVGGQLPDVALLAEIANEDEGAIPAATRPAIKRPKRMARPVKIATRKTSSSPFGIPTQMTHKVHPASRQGQAKILG